MKGLRDSISAALPFLPNHRLDSGQRKQSLNLDQLLDESRSFEALSKGSLDFTLMSYRYWFLFQKFKTQFNSKPVKPLKMEDLWALGFAALLTRDNTPEEILVNDLVEVSKKFFGPHTGSISNAFFRTLLRKKSELLDAIKSNPELLLGPTILNRWKNDFELCKTMGIKVSKRPTSGVDAFNIDGNFQHYTAEAFKEELKHRALQAMNPGSWKFLEWLHRESAESVGPVRILDVCAAPGGKALGMWSLFNKSHNECKIYACDSKFSRLERLKENISRWNVNDQIICKLLDWTNVQPSEADDLKSFDPQIILADLPCSGLGTLHSRPDLLLEDIGARMQKLFDIQKHILQQVKNIFGGKNKTLFVSVCSVDFLEIENISGVLNTKAQFFSLQENDESEGIVAWKVNL